MKTQRTVTTVIETFQHIFRRSKVIVGGGNHLAEPKIVSWDSLECNTNGP